MFLTCDQSTREADSGAVWLNSTGVPPVNHAQDPRATFKLRHYRKGERGNVMIMTAIFAVGLVLAVGLCIDGARIYMTRAELQNAADAAALAAARELSSGTSGLTDAVTQAQAAALQANKYGLNRSGSTAPAVTISTVEFAADLNGTWYVGAGGVPSGTETSIKYVRVTTQTTNTPILFAIRALGNSHAESRSATAGMSAPINSICDFFPVAVALDPTVQPGDASDGYPAPNTEMWLTFNQGTGSQSILADKDYIVISADGSNAVGDTTAAAAGLTDICTSLNSQIAIPTDSANQNNGPKQIAKGVDTRFDDCLTGSTNCDIQGTGSPLNPTTFPPDTNVRENITFQQYDNRLAVTAPPNHPPGQDQRRILIVPIVWPATYSGSPPVATVRKWAALFLKDKPIVNSPCSKSGTGQNTCAQLHVEWIDEKLVLGRGVYVPGAGCTTFALPVLYK